MIDPPELGFPPKQQVGSPRNSDLIFIYRFGPAPKMVMDVDYTFTQSVHIFDVIYY